jgi:hypothetical protein
LASFSACWSPKLAIWRTARSRKTYNTVTFSSDFMRPAPGKDRFGGKSGLDASRIRAYPIRNCDFARIRVARPIAKIASRYSNSSGWFPLCIALRSMLLPSLISLKCDRGLRNAINRSRSAVSASFKIPRALQRSRVCLNKMRRGRSSPDSPSGSNLTLGARA